MKYPNFQFSIFHFQFLILIAFILTACQSNKLKLEDLKPLDLTEKGIPMTIKAPSSPKIITDSASTKLIMTTSLEVVAQDYHIHAEIVSKEMANPSLNAEAVKASRLNFEKGNIAKGKFESVVLDEPQGFVYKVSSAIKGDTYHFFYVVFKDGKQIEFSDFTGASERFSEGDAKLMYASVKQ